MPGLTRQEKAVLLFLCLSFFAGMGISSYKKAQRAVTLDVRPYKLSAVKSPCETLPAGEACVNINSAGEKELTLLPGVGQNLARRITQYRNVYGPFEAKEELMRVKGIAEKKFEAMKDLITLE